VEDSPAVSSPAMSLLTFMFPADHMTSSSCCVKQVLTGQKTIRINERTVGRSNNRGMFARLLGGWGAGEVRGEDSEKGLK
jgi:hypothetical protein